MTCLHERILEFVDEHGGAVKTLDDFLDRTNLDYPPGDVLIASGELTQTGLLRYDDGIPHLTTRGEGYLSGEVSLQNISGCC